MDPPSPSPTPSPSAGAAAGPPPRSPMASAGAKRHQESARQWRALFSRSPPAARPNARRRGTRKTSKTPPPPSRKRKLGTSRVSLTPKRIRPARLPKPFTAEKETPSKTDQKAAPSKTNQNETVVSELKNSKNVSAFQWKSLLDQSGPRRGSASMRLLQESKGLVAAARTANLTIGASVIDYDTIKDKHSPKQKKYGFAPRALSQWHWFFVATRKVYPVEGKDNVVKFSLKYDKFQLAQGTCVDMGKMKGKRIYSYGCDGAKQLETSARRKQEFIRLAMGDTEERRESRLKHARAHKECIKHWGRGRTRFVDMDGVESFYSGMPIGGEHDWDYQDAKFVETAIATGNNTISKWFVTKVRWREVKVHQGRWAIDVEGEMQSSERLGFPHTEELEYVLIADQMATKLSPISYHVELKGIQIPCKGHSSKTQILQSFVEAL